MHRPDSGFVKVTLTYIQYHSEVDAFLTLRAIERNRQSIRKYPAIRNYLHLPYYRPALGVTLHSPIAKILIECLFSSQKAYCQVSKYTLAAFGTCR